MILHLTPTHTYTYNLWVEENGHRVCVNIEAEHFYPCQTVLSVSEKVAVGV